MREYRGYYEVTADFAPKLGMKLYAGISSEWMNRLHWQSGVEILCQLKGHMTVEVEQTPWRLSPGDVLVIDSHLTHRCSGGEPDGLQLQVIVGETLLHRDDDRLIRLSTLGEQGLPKDHPDVAALRSACGRLAELCYPLYRELRQLEPQEEAAVDSQQWHLTRAELHGILALLLRHTVPTGRAVRRVPPEFLCCVEFVQAHHCESITADDVAAACGCSRRTVFRLFQNHMGIPLKEYLSYLRMQTACARLLRSEDAVAVVAGTVGLSESQFYRVFQQFLGTTPGEWQRAVPTEGQLFMDFSQRREQTLDWDWITGRRGWNF